MLTEVLDVLNVKVKLLHDDAEVPAKATDLSSGYDIKAYIQDRHPVTILPNNWLLIKTGFSLDMMSNDPIAINTNGLMQLEAQVRSRSGLALKNGIAVLNGIGTIDKDYLGEVGVILYNHSQNPFVVKHGDRIAQLVFGSVINPTLSTTQSEENKGMGIEGARGEGGFGSTGV